MSQRAGAERKFKRHRPIGWVCKDLQCHKTKERGNRGRCPFWEQKVGEIKEKKRRREERNEWQAEEWRFAPER